MKGKIFMYRRDDAVTFTEIDGGFVKDYRSNKYAISTSINTSIVRDVLTIYNEIPYDAEIMIIEAIIEQNFDSDFIEKIVPILVNKIISSEPQFETIPMPEHVKTELGTEYYIKVSKCIATAMILNITVQSTSSKSILSKLDELEPLSCMTASLTDGVRNIFPSTYIGLICMEMAYVLTESDHCPITIPISEKSAKVLKATGKTLLKKYIKGTKDGSIKPTDEDIFRLIEDFIVMQGAFRKFPIIIKDYDVRYAWLTDINRRCLEQEMLPTDMDDTEAYRMLYSVISNFDNDGEYDGDFSVILRRIKEKAGYDEDEDEDDIDDDDIDDEEFEDEYFDDDDEDEIIDIEEFKRNNPRSHKIDRKDISKMFENVLNNLTSILGNLTSESEDEEDIDEDEEDIDEDEDTDEDSDE